VIFWAAPSAIVIGGAENVLKKKKEKSTFDAAEVAREYLDRGWRPVPIDVRQKKPRDSAWQSLTVTEENAEEFFESDDNIGIQLGKRSGGLTDVDIDCPEALELAALILPPTGAVFGRKSKRKSHRLYKTDLCATEQKAAIQFREPPALSSNGKKPVTLVELRIGAGDKGAQTLAPGSLHPSGEEVRWDNEGDPASVSGADLKKAVSVLAVATLLTRHYPPDGSRHEAALVLGGVLARWPGATADWIESLVSAIARCAGDEEADERGKSAAGAVELLMRGAPTPGLPRMHEVWGADVADTVAKWLGLTAAAGNIDDAEIERLAGLDPISYERERKKAADRLGINRLTVLDKLVEEKRQDKQQHSENKFLVVDEPWPEAVDGNELLIDLCDAFERHVVLTPSAALACALWTLHAYAHDAATHSPILDISSPTKRCGKTQLLGTAALLVPKPLPAANLTTATVFRAINKWHPTLLIDEMDTFLAHNLDLRGVLNSGHDRRSAYVLRCVGDESEPTQFSTWTPKIFAHIGRVAPTLEDRSVRIELRRRLKTETIERIPTGDPYADLRSKCARWAADSLEELRAADPKIPAALNDRASDNWRPLLAIADACGLEKEAREAALTLSEVDDDETDAIVLLRDLFDIFDGEKEQNPSAVSMSSAEITAALAGMEDRKWPEYRGGDPITPTQLAALLKPFKIFPRKVSNGRGRQVQGYRFKQFSIAFRHYLGSKAEQSP
jgi:hypothetical protein